MGNGRQKVRLKMIIGGVFFGVIALGSIPVVLQNKMIYFPSRYDPALKPGVGQIKAFHPYRTLDGREQWGYLIEPTQDSSLKNQDSSRPRFYLAFYGNAGTAMQMADFFEDLARRTGCGFFIVDYRGYGFNGGRPTESGLVADALGAYDTMKKEGRFENGVGVIGHSLGGAAGFAVAEKRHVDRLITISAFTSIDAMAKRTIIWPFPYFCWNHWPNDRRLAGLMRRPPADRPAEIILFHGRKDEIVPFEMGEQLAATPGNGLQFIPLDKAMHNDAHEIAKEDLARILKK